MDHEPYKAYSEADLVDVVEPDVVVLVSIDQLLVLFHFVVMRLASEYLLKEHRRSMNDLGVDRRSRGP